MTESTTSEADPESRAPESDAVLQDQDPTADAGASSGEGAAVEEPTDAGSPQATEPAGQADSTSGPAAEGSTDDGAEDAESGVAVLEREGDIAADYLEELLDIADLDGDLDMDVEGDRAAVSIVGGDVSMLVGRDGEVLEALQELTRLAVYRETGRRSRLMLDVGGFRADVRSRLERIAADAVEQVKASGERLALVAMSPFERKVVHDTVAAAGLASESEGEEPRRHVVVLPQ